jgi:hypothetical protein
MNDRVPHGDPLECREVLAEALADPALVRFGVSKLENAPQELVPSGVASSISSSDVPNDDARRAAYVLAVSVGRCRLFGVLTDGDLDGSLPLDVAVAAAQEMNQHICPELRAGANELPARLDFARAIEAEDLCADLLGGRLNAWAAVTALDEAYRAEDDESLKEVKKLAGALDYLTGELELVDDAVRKVAVELTLVASGHLLENWRRLLAPEFSEIAPWWLTGELEELAAELAEREARPWLSDQLLKSMRSASLARRVASESGRTIKVSLLGLPGPGIARTIDVGDGTTVAELLHEFEPDANFEDRLIRVNRREADGNQVVQDGDRVTITPRAIVGAAPQSEEEEEAEIAGGVSDAAPESLSTEYADEEEMARAADDGGFETVPTPGERRTIDYLGLHLPEILSHGNSDVWFGIDSDGALATHTYDRDIAAGYTARTEARRIPLVVDRESVVKPDIQKLLLWMTEELGLRTMVAEQLCVNLRWRC